MVIGRETSPVRLGKLAAAIGATLCAASLALVPTSVPAEASGRANMNAQARFPFDIAVAAASSTSVWAVGRYDGIPTGLLTEHNDGREWNRVPPACPLRMNHECSLEGIAVVAPGNVWAVGGGDAGHGMLDGLTEHWNGTKWTVEPAAHPADTRLLYLRAVSAPARGQVWAVGDVQSPEATGGIIEHWNGVRWTVASTTDANGAFTAVDFSGSQDGWALGWDSGGPDGKQALLAEHWNGNSWTKVLMPNPAPTGLSPFATGVTVLGPANAWVVGYCENQRGSKALPFAEHWNGHTWRIYPTLRSAPNARIWAVDAVSPASIWAVGENSDGIMIEHWDGSAWRRSAVDPGGDSLTGIVAVNAHDIWAVGRDTSLRTQPLREHFNGHTWTRG